MKLKYLMFLFFGALIMLYLGVFLGDLGGVGGYDGIAPLWLYEYVNGPPGRSELFGLAESGSILSLGFGLFLLAVFIVYLVVYIAIKVKLNAKNS